MTKRTKAAVDTASELDVNASFEQLLDELREVVAKLEGGDLPLEEAMRAFERGVRLASAGTQKLDSADRRVELLLENGTRDISVGSRSGAEVDL